MRGEGTRAIIPGMTGDPHLAVCPAPGHRPPIRASRLPHAMAAMYALAIAYASLQPFGEWLAPLPGTPFWAFTPWSMRATRFDMLANVLAYLPLGCFVALLPPRATPALRAAIAALAGAALSAAMETLQWFLPARSASVTDLVANAAGALAGGLAGAFYAQSRLRGAMRRVRRRAVLPGTIGDVGLALLAVWLVAQTNPAIAPFALTFDPAPIPLSDPDAAAVDTAAVLIEAAESAFQLVGVGLFVALLARERARAAGNQLPAPRVSFAKVLHVVQSVWLFLGVFEDLISERQKDPRVRRGQTLIRSSLTEPKRSRTCPRAVRQPIKGWLRLLKNESNERPVHVSVR